MCRDAFGDACRQPLARQPLVRQRLVEFTIELEVARQWAYYVAWLQTKGLPVAAEASASKYFTSEWAVRFYNMAVETMGLGALGGLIALGRDVTPQPATKPKDEHADADES